MPGKLADPFVDFRDIVRNLPSDQRSKVVGAGNLKLIEKGVVKWDDVVTRSRVRLFREVISREKIPKGVLDKLGIKGRFVDRAFAEVNTPLHKIIEQEREQLVKRLHDAGVSKEGLAELIAVKMTERITIGSVATKGRTLIGAGKVKFDPEDIADLVKVMTRRLKLGPLMKPPEVPPKPAEPKIGRDGLTDPRPGDPPREDDAESGGIL